MIKWGLRAIFSPKVAREEVNITWYSEIEEPIKSREKYYSLVVYILKWSDRISLEVALNIILFSFQPEPQRHFADPPKRKHGAAFGFGVR